MQQRLKQRLIGAVVLVALAVIFLPMILSGPVERTRVDMPLDVPEQPEPIEAPALPDVERLEEPDPGAELAELPRPEAEDAPVLELSPEDAEGGESAAAAADGETDRAVPDTGDAPPADAAAEDTAPAEEGGFAVQVGGFGSRDNAVRLRERLRADDFESWVDEAEVDGRTVYRVRVGPVAERAQAEALAQRLAEAHELPGLIIAR